MFTSDDQSSSRLFFIPRTLLKIINPVSKLKLHSTLIKVLQVFTVYSIGNATCPVVSADLRSFTTVHNERMKKDFLTKTLNCTQAVLFSKSN